MKKKIDTVLWAMAFSLLLVSCFGLKPGGDFKSKEKTLTATVEAVNLEARTVTLRNASGEVNTIKVNDDVKHLDKLKPGDYIRAVSKKAVAVRMALSNDMEIDHSVVEQADDQADKPAVSRVKVIKLFATIVGIDLNGQTVTLKDDHGNSKEVFVKDPERLKKVKLGDKIHITYAETYAVSVAAPDKGGND